MTLEQQRNYVRLHANNLTELHNLYVEYLYKLCKGVVSFDNFNELKFGKISNSHNCPIKGVTNFSREENKPISYYGFRVWIRGEWLENPDKYSNENTRSYIERYDSIDSFRYINGFNIGTFNGGEKFSGELLIFINDFPLIKKNLLSIVNQKDLEEAYCVNFLTVKRRFQLKKII